MSFILSFLGGALVTGSIVALSSPRSGKENQRRVKEYLYDVKHQTDEFSDALSEVKSSASHLMQEIQTIQTQLVPSVQETVEDFQLHAGVHTRRIQDDLKRIEGEVEDFSSRTSL